jgi:hypothetical protein
MQEASQFSLGLCLSGFVFVAFKRANSGEREKLFRQRMRRQQSKKKN